MPYASLNRKKKNWEIKAGKTDLPVHLPFQNFTDFRLLNLLSSYFLTWEQNIFVYLILRIKFSWNYVFKLIIGNAVFVTKPLLSLITKNMTHLVECSELV